ncbi:mechanosensitive ion channel family protein [Candidatus Latescibacterota bacterium]
MLQTFIESLDYEALSERVTGYLPNVVAAVALAVGFWLVAVVAGRLMLASLRRGQASEGPGSILVKLVRAGIFVVGALTIIDQLGIDVTSMVAGLGVAGLALSFAAQDTVANFISGITLAIDRPFKVGDWVAIGDLNATVTEMRLRTTVLTTFDNENLVLPNKALAQERIVNYTLTPRVRCRVSVGIAYKETIAAARKVILATLEGDERILPDPEPMVVVTGLGASSVDLQLRFWLEDPSLRNPMQSEYTEKVKVGLDGAGIEIPFPHLQLFVEDSDGVRTLSRGRG